MLFSILAYSCRLNLKVPINIYVDVGYCLLQFRHSISLTSMKLTNSTASGSSQSPYQTPETVAVKVYLDIAENHATNHYKSILVRCLESLYRKNYSMSSYLPSVL